MWEGSLCYDLGVRQIRVPDVWWKTKCHVTKRGTYAWWEQHGNFTKWNTFLLDGVWAETAGKKLMAWNRNIFWAEMISSPISSSCPPISLQPGIQQASPWWQDVETWQVLTGAAAHHHPINESTNNQNLLISVTNGSVRHVHANPECVCVRNKVSSVCVNTVWLKTIFSVLLSKC